MIDNLFNSINCLIINGIKAKIEFAMPTNKDDFYKSLNMIESHIKRYDNKVFIYGAINECHGGDKSDYPDDDVDLDNWFLPSENILIFVNCYLEELEESMELKI